MEPVTLPVKSIREPSQCLRGAQRHDPKYFELRESIRDKGVMVPILVRPDGDSYVLIDGMQRLTLSRETGRDQIPARVLHVTEGEALQIQIATNLHRIETTPVQFADQLRLMMRYDPDLTIPKLAVRLNVSPAWVRSTLRLLRLTPKIQEIVDRGDMTVANADALAKLPLKFQEDYLPLALEQHPREFGPKMTAVARKFKEGGSSRPKRLVHVDHFQRMTAVQEEIKSGTAWRDLRQKVKTPKEAWTLALKWVLHRDPLSREASKAREQELLLKQKQQREALEEEARKRRDT